MAFKKLTGKLGVVNARHLAHRATFNPNLTLINKLAAMDVDQAVNYLLKFGLKKVKIFNKETWMYSYSDYPRDLVQGKYFIHSYRNKYKSTTHLDITKNYERKESFKYDNATYAWWFHELQKCTGAQFKIAFFLQIQFICNIKSGRLGGNIFDPFDYLDLINAFVNRSAISLTKRMTIVDAITRFYNNDKNKKGGKDENLGRELMELFTVQTLENGKPPYSQVDVDRSSKVISGYRCNTFQDKKNINEVIKQRNANMDAYSGVPLSYMDKNRHDNSDKTFGKYYKSKTIKGSNSEAGAINEKDQLVNMLFEAPNTATAYARNLFHYFVGIDITDNLDKLIIKELEKSLKANSYNLHKVLFDLFTSREFYDLTTMSGASQPASKQGKQYIGGKIKSPLEFSLILLDHLKIPSPSPQKNNGESIKNMHLHYNRNVRKFCGDSGMPLFDVGIDGYQFAFRQKNYDKSWVTTSAILSRNSHVDWIVRKRINAKNFVDKTFKNPEKAIPLIEQMVNYFLARPFDKDSQKFALLKEVMLGNLSELSWEYEYKSGNTAGIKAHLEDVLEAILISPDYLIL